jgi:hypothetical protein
MVPTTLAFIAAYNTPQALAALSYEAFVTFAHQQGYCNRQVLLNFQHIPLQASPATVAVYQDEARLLAQQLRELILAKRQVQRDLNALFAQHPDQAIFASLPGVGEWGNSQSYTARKTSRFTCESCQIMPQFSVISFDAIGFAFVRHRCIEGISQIRA